MSFSRFYALFLFIISLILFSVGLFYLSERFEREIDPAIYLPSSTVMYVQSDYLSPELLSDQSLQYLVDYVPFNEYASIRDVFGDSLRDLVGFGFSYDDSLLVDSFFLFRRDPLRSFDVLGDLGSYYYRTFDDYIFISSQYDFSVSESDSLKNLDGYVRQFHQMPKKALGRGYIDIESLFNYIAGVDIDERGLFQSFVLRDFLQDLGQVGVRLLYDGEEDLYVLTLLNVFNNKIIELPEDHLLYSSELAAFSPFASGSLFFDGYGFAQKFEQSLSNVKDSALYLERLVDLYFKDIFEQYGIDGMKLLSFLEREYALFIDGEYRQLAFEYLGDDDISLFFEDALSHIQQTYPAHSTRTRDVILQDGTRAQWVVAQDGSLPERILDRVGSTYVHSLVYGGRSVLGYAQVGDVVLVSDDGDRLRTNLKGMFENTSLASTATYQKMHSMFAHAGSDFLYAVGGSGSFYDEFMLGRDVFGDNMFMKMVIQID